MGQQTKVDMAKKRLEEIMAECNAILSDPFIGRADMYAKLKKLRNEFQDLVQIVSPY